MSWVTGTASAGLPLPLTPAPRGPSPSVSLSYDSGSGNGLFGHGWSLSVPQIARRTDERLPAYIDAQDSDEFLFGGDALVPVFDGDTRDVRTEVEGEVEYRVERFRPRTEGAFTIIERWTATWARERDATCVAARTEPAATIAARSRCLDQRRTELGLLLARIGSAPDEPSASIGDALAVLPSPGECRAVVAGAADPRPLAPRDAQLVTEVDAALPSIRVATSPCWNWLAFRPRRWRFPWLNRPRCPVTNCR